MDSQIWFFGIAALLAIILLVITARSGGNRKYRVVMADNPGNVLIVYRKWNDGWSDTKDLKVYHNGDGKKIILCTHWIIRLEEMNDADKT